MRATRAARVVLAASCNVGVGHAMSHADGKPPEPPAPTEQAVRQFAVKWTEQEEKPGYTPPQGAWPSEKVIRGDIPGLRSDLKRCGDLGSVECQRIAFRLGVAYLGGTLFGHAEDAAREEHELRAGAEILRTLAERGSPEGACGWAFCLYNGEGVKEDEELARHFHQQAAAAGYAQSMHELGTMHYLGDGVPSDGEAAVHWFREAAKRGVSASMYLLGECLLEGRGTSQNKAAALGWLAAAAELGHRSARERVLNTYLTSNVEPNPHKHNNPTSDVESERQTRLRATTSQHGERGVRTWKQGVDTRSHEDVAQQHERRDEDFVAWNEWMRGRYMNAAGRRSGSRWNL